jgi:uncharacterized protein DUF6152
MKRKIVDLLALAGILLMSSSVLAHHGGTTLYDLSKQVTMKATITALVWANPHVEIEFDAADEKGTVRHWTLENNSPPVLVTRGWNRNTLKPGDMVTITFNPGREVPNVGRVVKILLADGKEIR